MKTQLATFGALPRKQKVVLYCSIGFFFAGCVLMYLAVIFALPQSAEVQSLKVIHKVLHEADEIEVRVLADVASHPTLPRYRTKIDGEEFAIVSTQPQRFTKAQTKEFLGILKEHDFDARGGALCHKPGYLLRFSHHGHTLLKASLCLHCINLEMEPFPFVPVWVSMCDPRSTDRYQLQTLEGFFARLNP